MRKNRYTHTQPEKGKGGRKRNIEITTRSGSKEFKGRT